MYVRQEALLSSRIEGTECTLDDIIATGDYVPPSPFSNLPKALEVAQARWLRANVRKLPAETP